MCAILNLLGAEMKSVFRNGLIFLLNSIEKEAGKKRNNRIQCNFRIFLCEPTNLYEEKRKVFSIDDLEKAKF